jgi:hypothetical protein
MLLLLYSVHLEMDEKHGTDYHDAFQKVYDLCAGK